MESCAAALGPSRSLVLSSIDFWIAEGAGYMSATHPLV